MSKFNTEVTHTPSFTEYSMSRQSLKALLERADIEVSIEFLWDHNYWYVCHEDWGRIFMDVLLNMPRGTSDKFDCENFAMLICCRISSKYKLNGCGIAIGDSPYGHHGYNIFISEVGLFYLEPQTGGVFSVEEDSGYKAELVIFG